MPLYEGVGLINEKQCVVIELGTAYTKIGFSGEHCPRYILPTDKIIPQKSKSDSEASESGNLISKYLTSCSEEEQAKLYDLFVAFLHQIYFKYLLVTPKERKVVIVESVFAISKLRNVLAKVLFLHYDILHILYLPAHLGAVTSCGTDTALVLDIGFTEAALMPVVAGVTMLSKALCHDIGAKKFDETLKELLEQNCLTTKFTVDEIQEILCEPEFIEDVRVRSGFVIGRNKIENLDELKQKMQTVEFDTKKGCAIEFEGIVRCLPAEIWFDNEELDGISLPQMLLDTLLMCPIDTRKQLAISILVTGGTIILPGFKARLLREVKALSISTRYKDKFSDDFEFKLFSPPAIENCLNWIGGSMYGTNETVTSRGVSKEFFLKHGHVPDWPDNSAVLQPLVQGQSISEPT